MSPKVSVIVPIYNVEEFLPRCLDSLLNQTLKEIEIICVNDGSKDNSLNILNEYAQKDARIIIINQENNGASSARNNGLIHATGEYIGYVDADDWVEKDYYKLLYENAKRYNADIACGEIIRPNAPRKKDIICFKHKGIKVAIKSSDKYKLCRLPERCFVWNKIYNREALLKTKIQFPLRTNYEDMAWSHIVVDKLNKVVTVPNAIYNYFWNEKSNSKSYADGFIEANNSCIEYAVKNRIKVTNFKFYTPQKRIRFILFGIRIFDIRIWECVKVFYILGIEVLKIYINK